MYVSGDQKYSFFGKFCVRTEWMILCVKLIGINQNDCSKFTKIFGKSSSTGLKFHWKADSIADVFLEVFLNLQNSHVKKKKKMKKEKTVGDLHVAVFFLITNLFSIFRCNLLKQPSSCFATLLKSHFGMGVSACKITAYFQNTFLYEHRAAPELVIASDNAYAVIFAWIYKFVLQHFK